MSLLRRVSALTDPIIRISDLFIIYVQVTVHRDKLRIKQPTRCIEYPIFILL